MNHLKNYYEILEITPNASSFEIQQAYQRLATHWHPDRHQENRRVAEQKFHLVSEAYEILSNTNSREHYDEMFAKDYSIDDAEKTFEQFFSQHGVQEDERGFFEEHYPNKQKSYYDVLQIPKNATLNQIKQAYRRLGFKYHPKNNPNDEEARRKFIEVGEAYNALSTDHRRQNYDHLIRGSIQPLRAHDIFQNFLGKKFFQFPNKEEFFKPILAKKWSRNLDRLMEEDEGDWRGIENGETVKTSSVYSNNNGVQSKKTVTTKKKVVKGVTETHTTEEYQFPNGTKEIRRIKDDGKGNVVTDVYNLKKGEQLHLQN